jgi:2-methylcitrate dehydratase PrpD
MSITRHFAEFLVATSRSGLDDAALASASRLLLDGIAVAALGAREPGPTALRALASETGARPVATVIGAAERTSAVEAARANGAAMHVLDYEPMWNPANHSLSTTLPAVLALAELLAERRGSAAAPDGRALLAALAMGIETQARLRRSSNQFEPGELVFHPPSTVGPLGSAVASGLLLGLDAEQLTHAIGIAASCAGGLQANIGSMTKALHCGGAAAAGLEAALLAERGFTADADTLAGPRGYGSAFFRDGFGPERLTEPHATLHIVEPGPAFKLYPSQYGTHFVITAALEAHKHIPRDARIRTVTIMSPPMPYVDRPAPASGLAGKFSFQYVAALALLDGEVSVESFKDERRWAHDLQELLPRITISPDAAREGRFDRMRVDVAVELENGSRAEGRCDGPPGIWGKPVDPALITRKAADCLSAAFGAAHGARVLDAARRFGDLDPTAVGLFLDLLGRVGREAREATAPGTAPS